jgi:hypothetical protein
MTSSRRVRVVHLLGAATAVLVVALAAPRAEALRTNMLKDVQRLEELGRHEEALFYRRSTMDLILAIHVPWSGAPYDPQMDGVYREMDRLYGNPSGAQHQLVETRTDRRYWNIVHYQKRAVADLLAKADLSGAQRQALEFRVRTYVEDQMSPEFDEMGNFFFRRKAWILERTGLLGDASFLRRLTAYYEQRVCVPYYAAVAEELEAAGQAAPAAAYRRKSEAYRAEAARDFHRSNGDRLLGEAQGGGPRRRLARSEVVDLLKAGLASKEGDARLAAASALADLGETAPLRPVTDDADPDVRAEAARATAGSPYARLVPRALRPGLRAGYFSDPAQQAPVAAKVLRAADFGFRGNERFPDPWRPYWEKDEIIPDGATGQFLVRLRGKVYLFRDGQYRFYVKTDGDNRAVVRITPPAGEAVTIISPKNDKQLLYADQRGWNGETLFRIDFSPPLNVKKGLHDVEIDYKGGQVKTPTGKAGLRLYWSSDAHVMEPVPAEVLFHDAQ